MISLEKILEVDRAEFCFMHYAETKIIPLDIEEGYPININFEILSNQVSNI